MAKGGIETGKCSSSRQQDRQCLMTPAEGGSISLIDSTNSSDSVILLEVVNVDLGVAVSLWADGRGFGKPNSPS